MGALQDTPAFVSSCALFDPGSWACQSEESRSRRAAVYGRVDPWMAESGRSVSADQGTQVIAEQGAATCEPSSLPPAVKRARLEPPVGGVSAQTKPHEQDTSTADLTGVAAQPSSSCEVSAPAAAAESSSSGSGQPVTVSPEVGLKRPALPEPTGEGKRSRVEAEGLGVVSP